jgi:hypothetical protein
LFRKKANDQQLNAELALASMFPGLCDNVDMQLPNIPSTTDEICAALNSFVEKNKQNTIDESALAALLTVPNCKHMDKQTLITLLFVAAAEVLECMSKICADSNGMNLFDQNDNNNANLNRDLQELAQMCAESSNWKAEKKRAETPPPPRKSSISDDLLDVNASELLNMLLANSGSPQEMDNDDFMLGDLKSDSSWEPKANGQAASSGGGSSSKPMTEEEQKVAAALQERIAINVSRLGTHSLNTVVIAQECKRIMIAYNIGQRLFAKFVMQQVVKVYLDAFDTHSNLF